MDVQLPRCNVLRASTGKRRRLDIWGVQPECAATVLTELGACKQHWSSSYNDDNVSDNYDYRSDDKHNTGDNIVNLSNAHIKAAPDDRDDGLTWRVDLHDSEPRRWSYKDDWDDCPAPISVRLDDP
jgi:hypothetical protein